MYYVIQVQTGKEQKVIEDIKKFKSNEVDFDVFAPKRLERRKYKGEWKDMEVRCFPGYLFVETDNATQLWKELTYVPDFTKLLGREMGSENFLPLNEEESRVIDILYNENSDRTTKISDIIIEEGDKIRIVTGPLMGIEGSVKKYNLHKRNATVELSLAGRGVTVQVGINIITKLN